MPRVSGSARTTDQRPLAVTRNPGRSLRIGFNVQSGEGARGLSIAVESFRESDTILGVYLIATGQGQV